LKHFKMLMNRTYHYAEKSRKKNGQKKIKYFKERSQRPEKIFLTEVNSIRRRKAGYGLLIGGKALKSPGTKKSFRLRTKKRIGEMGQDQTTV